MECCATSKLYSSVNVSAVSTMTWPADEDVALCVSWSKNKNSGETDAKSTHLLRRVFGGCPRQAEEARVTVRVGRHQGVKFFNVLRACLQRDERVQLHHPGASRL